MHRLSELVLNLYDCISSWEQEIIADQNITLQQMHTLMVIGIGKKMRPKDISSKLGVTTGTLSVMLNQLENKDLIEKHNNPEDQRSYFVHLTSEGKALFKEHHKYHHDLSKQLFSVFSESERTEFTKMLEKALEEI